MKIKMLKSKMAGVHILQQGKVYEVFHEIRMNNGELKGYGVLDDYRNLIFAGTNECEVVNDT